MSTRMRISTKTLVYHRIAASNDAPEHDIATNDPNVQNMGGEADFEYDPDTMAYNNSMTLVQDTTSEQITPTNIALNAYIYFKNTGFTSSTKDTSTTSDLRVAFGGHFSSGSPGFSLSPGESITLHGLSAGNNNLNEIYLDSSDGDIYVEIVYD